ncbi:condensation domain-containing protein, partial [Virgisporangium aurantiacum]|uniref:condensation domain-containing protein n=1 Tax=Virgisporangium aurantiacum TaxID=175570 RepID=UPI001EF3622B
TPLSFGQLRLWFLDRLDSGGVAYNVPFVLRLVGGLDVGVLERAVGFVVGRHEVLRSRFVVVDGVPRQVVGEVGWVSVPVVEVDGLAGVEGVVAEELGRRFDLAGGVLWRARLVRLGVADHVFVMVMHHVVCDEWSTGVLRRDLALAYGALVSGRAVPLGPLPVQYADFAVWQRESLRGGVLERQLGYWRGRLAGVPVLEVVGDRPRPPVRSGLGAAVRFSVDEDVVAGLRAVGHRHGVTMFMVLLAAFDVLLGRYTGQDDVVVGSPIANRGRPEVQDLVGFFVNTLVLRVDLSGDPTFEEVLGRVREVALGAYAHQDLPFEQVVEAVQPDRDLTRTPLF